MYNDYSAQDKMQILEDINSTIDLLYITQCRATKNALLNRLRRLLVQLTMYPGQNYPYNGNVIPAIVPPAQIPQYIPQRVNMPQMPPGLPQRGPQTLPQTPPQMQQGMPQAMQRSMQQGMPQAMQRSMQQGMPQGMQQTVPQRGPQTMPQSTQQPAPQLAPPSAPTAPTAPTAPPAGKSALSQRTFTADELSRYDGKGENPAYVGVNGVVYDVTDQPGWAAGSHFGLKAGLDQTSAYISCHTGQPMIDRLKVVGRLAK